ncbi:MAG: alpha/beta hydrolase [Clostridia bacterium]|nr:alpha/beta hydrolase [Clostridia bacterium]
MKKSGTDTAAGAAAGVAVGITVGIAAGIAGLLAGEYFFHIALDAATDKSALLKPAPGTGRAEKGPERERNAKEAVKILKAQYEEREILSFDHLRLHGYLCMQREPNRKWAVLVHGYDDSGLWFGREALAFYQAGFNLLLPDARGHGKSQGTYVGMGWHDHLDIKKWICWLVKQYPDSEIVLYGVSMGASAVMMAAGGKLPPNVKAAVEDCGYTSAWSVLSYQMKSQFHLPAFPFLYCADLVTRIRAGYGMKEADALKCVAGTSLPIFFIHGTEDRFVPFRMMKELYDACGSEKECLAVEGAAHVEAALAGSAAYWDRVFRFVGRYMEAEEISTVETTPQ